MKKIYLLFSFLIISIAAFCQLNVNNNNDTSTKKIAPPKDRNMFGLHIPRGLKINSPGIDDGYIIFSVPNSPYVYLLNRRGEVVHEWKANYGAFNAYLQNDGSIMLGVFDPDFPTFGFGGPYGRLEKISWDNKILWDYELANDTEIIHHDFAVMPNGHILAIAYEAETYDEAIAMGRKPEKTPKDGPWLEKIIEIVPEGKKGGKIVWEWHLKNHLIQDFDSKKSNYGKPADHPELLDVNMGPKLPPAISQDSVEILQAKGMEGPNATAGNLGADIFHFNAIKYNADLDQIVFSSPNLSEIFIIDHSTTTQQAATHKGGRWGKGGDFLYRWGNPKNYQRGDSTNEQLFGQHDVRWIQKGYPGEGDFTIFDNDIPYKGDSMNYSMIVEIKPPTDSKGNYYLEANKTFGPEKPVWTYIAPDTISFHGSFISGAERLKSGNTFINEGPKARFFEVTPDGKTVWEYLNPYRGNITENNGDPTPLIPMTYFAFRANFIAADHPALANKKLEPIVPQPSPFILPPPTTNK